MEDDILCVKQTQVVIRTLFYCTNKYKEIV